MQLKIQLLIPAWIPKLNWKVEINEVAPEYNKTLC